MEPPLGPSGPPPAGAAVTLVALGREVEARLNDALAPAGLSLRHLGALGHLARQPGLSYTELARRARVTPQSMHATVAGLVELGAVAPASPGRGKRALLEITERGTALLARGRDAVAAVDAQLREVGGLPPDADLLRLALELARRPPPVP